METFVGHNENVIKVKREAALIKRVIYMTTWSRVTM